MLIDEGPVGFCMTLDADHVLVDGRSQQLVLRCAVRIVAGAALKNSFVHLVVKRLCKRCLDVGMATETKIRLCNFQQMLGALGGVAAMASGASDTGKAVRGAIEVGVGAEVAG